MIRIYITILVCGCLLSESVAAQHTKMPANCRWNYAETKEAQASAFCSSRQKVFSGACASNADYLYASYPIEGYSYRDTKIDILHTNRPEHNEPWDKTDFYTGWQCKVTAGGLAQAWALCCDAVSDVGERKERSRVTSAPAPAIDNCIWKKGNLEPIVGDNLSNRIAVAFCGNGKNVVTGGCYKSGFHNENHYSLDHSAPFEGGWPVDNHIETGDHWNKTAVSSGWYCAWNNIDTHKTYNAYALCCGD